MDRPQVRGLSTLPVNDPSLARLVSAYNAEFRARMSATPEEVADAGATLARAAELAPADQSLLDALLLVAGGGERIDARLRPLIEKRGERLWLSGLLLPSVAPSPGATIDPRHYAASCRLHPALSRRDPLRALLPRPSAPVSVHFPPSDARWDAVIIAASLEATMPSLNRDGTMRRDAHRRLIEQLGDDSTRWELALSFARATGLVRPAGGRLYGFPESRPRPLVDPVALLEPRLQGAARALLRLVDEAWVDFAALLLLLRDQTRQVLSSPGPSNAYAEHPSTRFDDAGWARVETPLFVQAADGLTRLALLEGCWDAKGILALRRAGESPKMPPGFLLTPDLDILIGAWELPTPDYGRLCRLAPFVMGERVHRHKLTKEGVAADIAAGYADATDFLARHSRTGLPYSVRQSVEQWARSAERITVLSGATVVEQDGVFKLVSQAPPGARVIDYGGEAPPPASFSMQDGEILIPTGADALTVRAAVARIATLSRREPTTWRYTLSVRPQRDAEALLESLRRLHAEPELPGELEVAVLAAHELPACTHEEAVIVHLPDRAAEALRRDRVAGPLLARALSHTQSVVSRSELAALEQRLAELGVRLEAGGGATG